MKLEPFKRWVENRNNDSNNFCDDYGSNDETSSSGNRKNRKQQNATENSPVSCRPSSAAVQSVINLKVKARRILEEQLGETLCWVNSSKYIVPVMVHPDDQQRMSVYSAVSK